MRLLALSFALCLVAGIPAAQASTCVLSDGPGTFGVMAWDVPPEGGKVYLNYHGRTVIQPGPDGDDFLLTGVFVVDTATARTVAAAYTLSETNSMRARVELNGDVLVDQALPQRDGIVGGANAHTFWPLPVPGGNYHIVGISMGGGDGIGIEGTNDRDEAVTTAWAAPSSGLCELLPVSGELRHFDEADFTGTQVAVPGVGVRSNIRFNFENPRSFLVGGMRHYAHAYGFRSTLDIETPSGSGRVTRDIAPISSTGGSYRFRADQLGLHARINLIWLTYDVQ